MNFNRNDFGVPNAPCRNCTDRVSRCHSVCPKYEEYRKNVEAAKKIKIFKEREEIWHTHDVLKSEGLVR